VAVLTPLLGSSSGPHHTASRDYCSFFRISYVFSFTFLFFVCLVSKRMLRIRVPSYILAFSWSNSGELRSGNEIILWLRLPELKIARQYRFHGPLPLLSDRCRRQVTITWPQVPLQYPVSMKRTRGVYGNEFCECARKINLQGAVARLK